MKTKLGILSACLLTFSLACGGNGVEINTGGKKDPKIPGKPTTSTGETVSDSAQAKFNAAVETMVGHDKAADWNDAACSEVAKKFEDAASEQKSKKFPEATYNAGLAWQRCGNDKEARAHFTKALADDPKFHYAKVQLALYDYKGNSNEDAAISTLQQAVTDAQFQNVPALVNLAMFQMQRDSESAGSDCKNDMDCAKRNLQRALAIDDAYMPAFNQLALYYFQQAKKRAGAVKSSQKGGRGRQIATNAAIAKRADVQQLELAALVCSQAIRKNPNYAPIHNTAGLIQNELGQVNSAVAEFATAAKLDPKFFEAQMNYAAVNLSFRGFEQAATAYKKALEMRPNDYDAHLGLALALRGPIQATDANYEQEVAAVQAELDACKKLDANRPDAFYNEGILVQEFKAKAGAGKDATKAALRQAKGIFQTFTDKAQGKAEYDGAVKRSKERMQDIDDTIQFLDLDASEQKAQGAPGGPAPAATDAPAAGGDKPADKPAEAPKK